MRRGKMARMSPTVKESRAGRPKEMEDGMRAFIYIDRKIADALAERASQEGVSRSRIISLILCGEAEPLQNVG